MLDELRTDTDGLDGNIASAPSAEAQPDRIVGPVPFRHPEGDDLAPLNGSPATTPQETVGSALRQRPPQGRVRGRGPRWLDRLKRGERWKRRLPEVCR